MDHSESTHLVHAADTAASSDDGRLPAEDIHQRIGSLTRSLHNALRELGYDKSLQAAQSNLPDARDRLTFIARLTGEAAEKVLNAVDGARLVQDELAQDAASLRTRWQAVSAFMARGERNLPASKQLVDETCAFLAETGGQTDRTNAILTDIMMAQDFHDLTGQVVRKVVELATNLEDQLLKLLIEATPADQRPKAVVRGDEANVLDGPVVNAAGRDDVVVNQAGVDDLLASLGF